jgi:hypothetical protein
MSLIPERFAYWFFGGFVCLIAAVVFGCAEHQKFSDKNITPATVEVEHQKLAQEIKTLHKGDFMEWQDNLAVVASNQKYVSDVKFLKIHGSQHSGFYSVNFLAKKNPKITRMGDPNWLEVSKKFLGK